MAERKQEIGKKPESSKWIGAVIAFLVIMGPVGVAIGLFGLMIWLLIRAISAAQKGKNGAVTVKMPRKNRKKKADADRVFGELEGTRDNPFHALEEEQKQRFRLGRSEPHEFGSHVHVYNDDHSRTRRLEQLEVLKGAGLYTEQEYRDRKAQIIRETEP